MKLPAFLYGTSSEVRKNGRRMVAQLRRGVPWAELGGEMIDTRDVPGLIYVEGAHSSFHGEHFHTSVPARAIADAAGSQLPLDCFTTLFEPAISTLWGCMAMISRVYQFFDPPGHKEKFLQAVAGYWDELDAEGERYSWGQSQGERLWALPTSIHYCLGHVVSLPVERLREPLPPGGLRELINQTQARFDDATHSPLRDDKA